MAELIHQKKWHFKALSTALRRFKDSAEGLKGLWQQKYQQILRPRRQCCLQRRAMPAGKPFLGVPCHVLQATNNSSPQYLTFEVC